MEEGKLIQSFTDLIAWQKAHELVLLIYRETKLFPKEELFGITSQMRRSAVSMTSNIAEGFNRYSFPEKARFYSIALGSVGELHSQLLVCRDINLLSLEKFQQAYTLIVTIHKLITGLIKSSKSHSP